MARKGQIRNAELPEQLRERLVKTFGLPAYDASILTSSKALADYYLTLSALVMIKKLQPTG